MADKTSHPVQRGKRAADQAGGSKWARWAVLAGWAAKGAVYLALAWLVLQMAFGAAPQQASTTGALEYIANTAPGSVALVILGIGLLAYAVGRILEVTVMAKPPIEASDKVKAILLALIYTSLAISAFSIVGLVSGGGAGGGGSGQSTQQRTAAILLDLSGGQWLVGIVGTGVAALGLYTVYQGIEKRFLTTLRTSAMSPTMCTWSTRIGMVAYATKGIIFVLIGWFLVQAALTYDASEATGLDGALRNIADTSWGTAVLAAIAVGLLTYGLFCEIEARYRRVGVSATGTT